MPKLGRWPPSSEPVTLEYLTIHSQKSTKELKKSTEHDSEKNPVSSACNLQIPNQTKTKLL